MGDLENAAFKVPMQHLGCLVRQTSAFENIFMHSMYYSARMPFPTHVAGSDQSAHLDFSILLRYTGSAPEQRPHGLTPAHIESEPAPLDTQMESVYQSYS